MAPESLISFYTLQPIPMLFTILILQSCITLYRCSSNFKNPWRKSRGARVPCPTIIYLTRLYCSTAFISFRLCQSISDSAGYRDAATSILTKKITPGSSCNRVHLFAFHVIVQRRGHNHDFNRYAPVFVTRSLLWENISLQMFYLYHPRVGL